MQAFHALAFRSPTASALTIARDVAHADYADPAFEVFTDLRTSPVVSVPAAESLPQTRRLMQHSNVRLAFVTDASGAVIGYVTAADLQGERPMQAARERVVHYQDLTVDDMLTHVEDWATLDLRELAHASIGDVVATMRRAGARYLVVTEAASHAEGATSRLPQMRGLFSANRIERATGMPIDTELRSRSFADLAHALHHE